MYGIQPMFTAGMPSWDQVAPYAWHRFPNYYDDPDLRNFEMVIRQSSPVGDGFYSSGSVCSDPPSEPDISFLKKEYHDADIPEIIDITGAFVNASTVTSPSPKAKRTVHKQVEEELCLICGDRASGYHYNALSCEGCKGFFRRSITRNADYKCKYGGNCEMDMWMRRRCQYCRLRRCREVGMKPECLLSDDQCKARDARRKAKQRILHKDQESCPAKRTPPPKEQPDSNGTETPPPEVILQVLTKDDRLLIERLVFIQDKFELPSEADIKMLADVKVTSLQKMDMPDAVFDQMAGHTILVTHLVVEFAKCLPSFMKLSKEDQIALLKGSACEVMMIRTARRYDLETDTVVFADGIPYTRDNMRMGGLDSYVDLMFDFCRHMGLIRVDNAEYALLTAICIFSQRPGMLNPRAVDHIQESYAQTLQNYVNIRRPNTQNHLAHLLARLCELRELSVHYEKVLENMKVQHGPLPPLLMEYFGCTE